MKKVILIIISFLILSCNSPQTYYENALKLADQEKYEEAITLLDKAIEKQPDFLDALIQRGYYQMNLKKYQLAVKDFEKALSVDLNNTLALYDLGNCKYNLGEYNDAIIYYNKALKTKGGEFITLDFNDNPNFKNPNVEYDVPTVEIIFSRADSYLKLDSLKKAYFDYQHCIDNNYMVADSYYMIAYLYFVSNNDELGCEALHKSIQFGCKDIHPEYLKRCKIN